MQNEMLSPQSAVGNVQGAPSASSPSSSRENDISVIGDEFFPDNQVCVKFITETIKGHFMGPYISWKKVSEQERSPWFEEFGTAFHWQPQNTTAVHRVFEHRGSVAMASMLLRDYQACVDGGINLAGNEEAKELGYDLGIAETFRRTHSIKQKDNKRETFKAKWSEAHSSEGSTGEEMSRANGPQEVAVWLEAVGGVKKGRAYGLAGQARCLFPGSSSSPTGSSSSSDYWEKKFEEQLKKTELMEQQLSSQNEYIKETKTRPEQVEAWMQKMRFSSVQSSQLPTEAQ
ncbi:hypothetical protein Tsubulata_022817, partial [Turnera subulata]